MKCEYKGLNNLELDRPSQVEFNRQKNIEQDKKLATLSSQVNQLLEQAPAGFLPRVYYGFQQGQQTYRFPQGFIFEQTINGNIGDAYDLVSAQEESDYIAAVAVKLNDSQMQIAIRGDYISSTNEFSAINTRTGESTAITLSGLGLYPASYLGEYPPQNNREKQITVLKSLEFNTTNIVFASIDYNADGTYNWVRIGQYVNGVDGKGVYQIDENNYNSIITLIKEGDLLISIGDFQRNNLSFGNYNLYIVTSLNPVAIELKGNIKGETGAIGETGAQGPQGLPGANGLTPTIQDGYWWIGTQNTGVKALGVDGTDGEDGKSFNIQSGLFSSIENYGKENNVGPEGETLAQLPTLPTTGITGNGYVVYDPLTTPLQPYYDLYWANDNDSQWTIIHPFNGINGRNGEDGATPYIQNGYWYINDSNTGISATGPQGPRGKSIARFINNGDTYMDEYTISNLRPILDDETQLPVVQMSVKNGVGIKDIEITPNRTTSTGTIYDMNVKLTNDKNIFAGDFEAPIGPQGAQGPQGTTLKQTIIYDMNSDDPNINKGFTEGAGPGKIITWNEGDYDYVEVYASLNRFSSELKVSSKYRTGTDFTLFAASATGKVLHYLKGMYYPEQKRILASLGCVYTIDSTTNQVSFESIGANTTSHYIARVIGYNIN